MYMCAGCKGNEESVRDIVERKRREIHGNLFTKKIILASNLNSRIFYEGLNFIETTLEELK